MTSVFLLLSLPQTSKGLSEIQPTAVENVDGSASYPRKVARLITDSDSASASRPKPTLADTQKPERPIQIQIIGDHETPPPAGDKQLALLRRCIRSILTRFPGPDDTIPATYEGIYNECRSVILVSNLGDDLYNILRIELEQSIGRLSKALTESTETKTKWITSFSKALKWFDDQMGLLRSLLTYLDQVYVLHSKDVLHIRDFAYLLVNDKIFGNPQIAERLRAAVQDWFKDERREGGNGYAQTDHAVIQELIRHLLTYNQYSAFEEFYITITRSFYLAESMEQAEALKSNPKEFFRHAMECIDEEINRSKAILPVAAWALVREVTEKAVLGGRMEWLSENTLADFMGNKDFAALQSMYMLFARVAGTKPLCDAFRNHIRASVTNIVKDATRDEEMVERLLQFKVLADRAMNFAFIREKDAPSITSTGSTTSPIASTSELPAKLPDQDFVYALADAFAVGFKARRNKPAEMIAKYLDKAMRKGQGSTNDAEFQALLDSALALYRFTEDKDVFRTFYHRSLAKRLLLDKTASDDFEIAMLKKLKHDYDPEFGMGEDMFKDLALSREAMREYHSKLPEHSPGQLLTAMVLQRSAWPFTAQKHIVDLPPNMQAELTKYGDYYKSKHSGRILDWIHLLGTATLKARFKAGTKELSVSLYQAIVLLLFNDTTDIPFVDIKEQTNIDDAELRRVLQSLACAKKKVLKKLPAGKDINDTDVFKFNADFNDPRPKVHINSIQVKVSLEESKRTNKSIEDDRKFALDAAIVRIMKARKEMTYEHLKAATIDAVKSHFVPQVDSIKRRIDALVEGEYLERSEDDRNRYKYIA